jgi:HK97 family phage prohead protease
MRETKQFAFEVASVDGEGRTLEGYAAAFGNVDAVGDIIHPGAFAKTITERGSQVKLLWQHQQGEPLGRVMALREDPRGLFIKAVISDTARGRDALALLKDGAIGEMSIGYDPVIFDYSQQDAKNIRNLREIKLHEVSLVSFPANSLAQVTSLKACGPSEGKPWNVFPRGEEYCVFMLDGDGAATGDTLGCHDTEEAARQQVEALYVSEGKATTPTETKVGRVLAKRNAERLSKIRVLLKELEDDAGINDESNAEAEAGPEDGIPPHPPTSTAKMLEIKQSELDMMIMEARNGLQV